MWLIEAITYVLKTSAHGLDVEYDREESLSVIVLESKVRSKINTSRGMVNYVQKGRRKLLQ